MVSIATVTGTEESSPATAPDFCCAICLELLYRPVVLSCGHRFCRGCWLRVLESRDVRATAHLTGCAACPLGRCKVSPAVPEVSIALSSELESRFGVQYTGRSSAFALADEEERAATEANEWVAAGCKADMPEETVTISSQHLQSDVSAVTSRCWMRTLNLMFAGVGALLFCMCVGMIVLVVVEGGSKDARERSSVQSKMNALIGTSAGLGIIEAVLLALRFRMPYVDELVVSQEGLQQSPV